MQFVSIAIAVALMSVGYAYAGEPTITVGSHWKTPSGPSLTAPPMWAIEFHRNVVDVKPTLLGPRCSPNTCATIVLREPIPPTQVEQHKHRLRKVTGGTVFVSHQKDGSTKFVILKQ